MNAFQKAIARIETEAAAHGGYPASIALTRYPDAATFNRFYPGGDFADHVAQREAVLSWCRHHGIDVQDIPVTSQWPESAEERGRRAAREGGARRYRLGLNLSRNRFGQGSVGWFMIDLAHKRDRGGED